MDDTARSPPIFQARREIYNAHPADPLSARSTVAHVSPSTNSCEQIRDAAAANQGRASVSTNLQMTSARGFPALHTQKLIIRATRHRCRQMVWARAITAGHTRLMAAYSRAVCSVFKGYIHAGAAEKSNYPKAWNQAKSRSDPSRVRITLFWNIAAFRPIRDVNLKAFLSRLGSVSTSSAPSTRRALG